MSRNPLGQYEKGTSGNPRGRPRKRSHPISDSQLRKDFFEAAEMPVPIIEGNERKMVPAREAIDKQLVVKAVSGDMRAMREYYRMRDRYTIEHVKLQLENLRVIVEAEDRIREFPEDVTDEFKYQIQLLKQIIDQNFLP